MKSARVAIIVLTWNQKSDTLECLGSLSRVVYDDYFVVLVDNGSVDGTAEEVSAKYPAVHVINTGDNLGYVGGNNVGMEFALAQGADYVFILNNDTTVAPDFLNHLVGYADAHPKAGMVGPKVYMYDRPKAIWFAGASLTRYGTVWHTAFGDTDEGGFDQNMDCIYIPGCSVLVRRELIERIGMLDPKFFYLYEEVDWCFRARQAGYSLVLVPAAHIWHKEARAYSGTKSPRYLYYFTRNHLLFFRKNFSGWSRYRLYFYKLQGSFKEWQQFRRDVNTASQFQAEAIWAGVLDFALGRFGKCPHAFARV
jgi:hypothetical protein